MINAILVTCLLRLPLEGLLTDESNEPLTIPVVAARAGVHPTTVYRRWGPIGELLADVATSHLSGDIVCRTRDGGCGQDYHLRKR